MMSRTLSTREKVMLMALAVMLILVGYVKLVLEPINNQISDLQLRIDAEQSELEIDTVKLAKMKKMETELESIRAAGEATKIPSFDNSVNLMLELHAVLAQADEYSLNFAPVTEVTENAYIMRRPIVLQFTVDGYETARKIFDDLYGNENFNQISDISMSEATNGRDTSLQVTLSLDFYELQPQE